MSNLGIFSISLALLLSLVGIAAYGMILARLYKRATKETSFVRTGFGGQKVVMNGGALVFPVLHDTIPVNMNTLRLAVSRRDGQALITRDRMRVDVVAEFYVRTQPSAESIANAAQTLGERTMHPQTLKDLVEGKFVDALRSVAAEMTMEELHEKRTDFVQKVQQAVTKDLLQNGLELETVSLTALDQTDKSFFNPNNAFDAEGLTHLTEEIERRRKVRNDIEQETNVQITAKIMESEKERLEIGKEEEYARLKQQREIEIRKASQTSEIAKEQALKQREAEEAEIHAKQEVEQTRIEMERSVREKAILKEKILELAEQDRQVAIAEKSKEKSEAEAIADRARALAVAEEEKVKTSRETEIAERQKQIELIRAHREAEREAISVRVAAEAEKQAAKDHADAIREIAQAEADKKRINAEASKIAYQVDAEGQQALNEAANLLSSEQISLSVKMKLIENLDKIIRESVRPMENIEGIKIIQVDGLGAGKNGTHIASGEPTALSDQVVNSALKYRAQAPLLDSLLKEVGINGGDINGLTSALSDDTTPGDDE
ncbi:MAG: Inner membrane protein YqiK [Chlamydiia bacterium]|nr:Inner membrane protein YqiK [Chlamydiia bacterium]MCH9615331.1 Inner membrane protein YqiK [Chlamydiia bacterium]MCH9628347.1 Inner membrane protein YqiK [Chlamydiia bacterium]